MYVFSAYMKITDKKHNTIVKNSMDNQQRPGEQDETGIYPASIGQDDFFCVNMEWQSMTDGR